MKTAKILFCVLFSILFVAPLSHADGSRKFTPIEDKETLEYLLSKAVRLSGINPYPLSEMPPLFSISKADLNKEVCPEDPGRCRNLAAVFDDIGYRILILDDLEVTSNFQPFNYSFVIHELVHSLQYRSRGAGIFNGCAAVYETEREAYEAQDAYLKEEGEFFRASSVLKYFFCDEALAHAEYLKSKAAWDFRNKSGDWKL